MLLVLNLHKSLTMNEKRKGEPGILRDDFLVNNFVNMFSDFLEGFS
jgi:hypothetical protein